MDAHTYACTRGYGDAQARGGKRASNRVQAKRGCPSDSEGLKGKKRKEEITAGGSGHARGRTRVSERSHYVVRIPFSSTFRRFLSSISRSPSVAACKDIFEKVSVFLEDQVNGQALRC